MKSSPSFSAGSRASRRSAPLSASGSRSATPSRRRSAACGPNERHGQRSGAHEAGKCRGNQQFHRANSRGGEGSGKGRRAPTTNCSASRKPFFTTFRAIQGDRTPDGPRMHRAARYLPAIRGLALCSLAVTTACGSLPSGKREHACMTRVMYFESNRSSAEGMLAVGTVVMNRVEFSKFPDTVCEVVAQKTSLRQGHDQADEGGEEPGARSKIAKDVLEGKRHRALQGMFSTPTATASPTTTCTTW